MHNVFISYYHDEDQKYKEQLSYLGRLNNIFVDGSVHMGDIDDNDSPDNIYRIIRENYLKDTTVTIVLVGLNTCRRKYVDWEIGSSIRKTSMSSRSRLLLVFLPEYISKWGMKYSVESVGQRMYDNLECGYAEQVLWTEFINSPQLLKHKIDSAYNKRYDVLPNSSALFRRNNSPDKW